MRSAPSFHSHWPQSSQDPEGVEKSSAKVIGPVVGVGTLVAGAVAVEGIGVLDGTTVAVRAGSVVGIGALSVSATIVAASSSGLSRLTIEHPIDVASRPERR